MEPIRPSPEVINVLHKKGLPEGILKARRTILSGGIVVFPTESFYGLAVNSLDEKAIKRLFRAKKRKSDQPILLLIPSPASLEQFVLDIPVAARQFIKRFWPGGLTLIFQAAPGISPLLTAGTGKIGIRLSGHPIADALVKSVNIPLTGTSANLSGQPPCSRVDGVIAALGESVDLILDGGETAGRIGSTVLDVTVDPPRILRQGIIPVSEIESVSCLSKKRL